MATKKQKLNQKTNEELVKLLVESRETLRTERFSAAGARAKDPNAPKKLKKMIARVLTEQRKRAITA